MLTACVSLLADSTLLMSDAADKPCDQKLDYLCDLAERLCLLAVIVILGPVPHCDLAA